MSTEFQTACIDSCARLYNIGLKAMASSVGKINGIECRFNSDEPDEDGNPSREFFLITESGDYRLLREAYLKIGLLTIIFHSPHIDHPLEMHYTDVNVISAVELYRISHGNKCFPEVMQDGEIIAVGNNTAESYRLCKSLCVPSCLVRFEHFCRDCVWLDDNGKIVNSLSAFSVLDARLDVISMLCVENSLSLMPDKPESSFDDVATSLEIIKHKRLDAFAYLAELDRDEDTCDFLIRKKPPASHDVKFKYIIPVDEIGQDGSAFLFDRERVARCATEEHPNYIDFMCAEELIREKMEYGTLDFSKPTAELAAAERGFTSPPDQERFVRAYNDGDPIRIDSSHLEKHYGFPW